MGPSGAITEIASGLDLWSGVGRRGLEPLTPCASCILLVFKGVRIGPCKARPPWSKGVSRSRGFAAVQLGCSSGCSNFPAGSLLPSCCFQPDSAGRPTSNPWRKDPQPRRRSSHGLSRDAQLGHPAGRPKDIRPGNAVNGVDARFSRCCRRHLLGTRKSSLTRPASLRPTASRTFGSARSSAPSGASGRTRLDRAPGHTVRRAGERTPSYSSGGDGWAPLLGERPRRLDSSWSSREDLLAAPARHRIA
jgi:hypothetical protein